MRRFVIGRNLERYRALLARESDAGRRAVLARLLAEQEREWDELNSDGTKTSSSDDSKPS